MPSNTTTPPTAAPAWLSIDDVAEQLKVHHSLVRRLIGRRELPAAKIGGIYRLRQADVDAFLDASMTTRAAG